MTGREPSGAVGKKPVLKRDEALVVNKVPSENSPAEFNSRKNRKETVVYIVKERERGWYFSEGSKANRRFPLELRNWFS